MIFEGQRRTIPDIWHMIASSLQKPLAALSCTFREKLMHAQLLTLPPLTIFYPGKRRVTQESSDIII
jgi:hypothetical protein